MSDKIAKKVFGFDIGTSSLGWSVVQPEVINNETGEVAQTFKIIDSGVYLFSEPVVPKSGELLNAKRREKRLARRGRNRKINRNLRIKELIVKYGLAEMENLNDTNKDGSPNKNCIFITKRNSLTPYELRVKGLREKLSEDELARVLFHCAKYRGFLSNKKESKKLEGKEAKEDDKAKELGKVLQAGEENQKLLQESGFKTMTELMLSKVENSELNKNIHNRSGDYTNSILREYVQDEVGLILQEQRKYYPALDSEFEEKYYKIAFENRPLKGFFDKIGLCTLLGHEEILKNADFTEDDIKRAPKNSVTAQEFVALSRLSNLVYSQNGKRCFLTIEQIEELIKLGYTKAKVTFTDARKLLNLDVEDYFYGLSYAKKTAKNKKDQKEAVEENTTEQTEKEKLRKIKKHEDVKLIELSSYHELKKILTNSFESLSTEQLDTIAESVTYFKQPEDIDKYLKDRNLYSVVEKDLDNIYALDFTENINYSHKALYILLPVMKEMASNKYDSYKKEHKIEKPIDVYHAIEIARAEGKLPKLQEKTRFNLLPSLAYLDEHNIDTPLSPSVRRAITSYRHVFNSLVKKYGKPDECNFELLRSMFGVSKKKGTQADIESKTIINDSISKEARELGASFEAVKLWKQQGQDCLYCQKKITPSEVKYTQVDHILPYSQTFDNSLDNKVTVHAKCNQDKGNRTPFEWYSETGKNWDYYFNFVQSKKSTLKRRKVDNLINLKKGQELVDAFTNRQFSESAYIARFIKNYTQDFFNFEGKGKKVRVVNGTITALLRKVYGLTKYRSEEDLKKHKEKIEEFHIRKEKEIIDNDKKLTSQDIERKVLQNKQEKEIKLKNANKNYVGDKHHAVDAILVAIVSNSLIHKVSNVLRGVDNSQDHQSGRKAMGFLYKTIKQNVLVKTANLEADIDGFINKMFISKKSNSKYNGPIHEETIYGSIKLGSLKPSDKTYDKEYITRDFDIATQRTSVPTTIKDLDKTIKLGDRGVQYSYHQYVLSNQAREAIREYIVKKANKEEVGDFPYFIDKNGNKNVIRSVTKLVSDGIKTMYKLQNTNKQQGNKKFVGYVKSAHKIRTDIFTTKDNKGNDKFYIRPVTLADLTLLKSTSETLGDNLLNLGAGKTLSKPEGDENYKFVFSLHPGEAFSFLQKDENGDMVEKNVYYCGYHIRDNQLEYKTDCSSKKVKSQEYISILSIKGLAKLKLDYLGNVVEKIEKEDYTCPIDEYEKYLNDIKLKNQTKNQKK